jgi:EAL domain-containing protein (putative c-di-GMP-specific phosphodiesterase class I)
VKTTIGLARELGLQVVAEGVETREQFELLKAWGCRSVQGFYFSRPHPAEELTDLLRRGTIHPRPQESFAHDLAPAGHSCPPVLDS